MSQMSAAVIVDSCDKPNAAKLGNLGHFPCSKDLVNSHEWGYYSERTSQQGWGLLTSFHEDL